MQLTKEKSSTWLDFELNADHVVTGHDKKLREHYLLRLAPKQMDILGLVDRLEEIARLQTLLDGCEKIVPSFFILDKTEGMGHIREYQQGLMIENPAYEFIFEDLLRQIDGIEAESASVERAFYMCVSVRDRGQLDLFCSQLNDRIPYYIAKKDEWIVVLRNFLLREYTTFGLAEFDEAINLEYEKQVQFQQQRRRPKSVDYKAVAREETRRMLLPIRMDFNTRYCEQNDFLRKTICVRNYPTSFETDCVLRRIACMENTSMRIHLEPLSSAEVSALVNAQSSNSVAKSRGGKAAQRIEGDAEQEQIKNTYRDMIESNEKMFFVTILIEIYAADVKQLNLRAEKIKNLLLTYGITKDDMLYQQRECFLSMLPFGENHISLSRNMPSSTFAALYPFTSSKKVDDHGLLLGRTTSGGPVIWDPYLRNDDLTSGNFLIVGAPGMGKSYLAKKILSQLIAKGVSCFVLDPENEYGDLFRGLQCSNIECGIGGYIINPFEVRIIATHGDDTPHDADTPEAFKNEVALRQHLSWLRDFLPILLPDMTTRELNILTVIIQEHYRQYGIDDRFDPSTAKPTDYPTFSTLYEYVNQLYNRFDANTYPEFNREDLQNILLQLRDVYDGSGAPIFNGHTNVPNADVINFQLQTLLNGSAQRMASVMFNIMTWVMTKLIGNPKQQQAFIADEAYLMIDRQFPVLMKWMRNYMKRDRKYEGICGLLTQNLGDLNDPEIMHVSASLLQLPPHKFIFNLGDVDPSIIKTLLDLEDHEIKIIARSRKRQCLLKCGHGKYHMEVGALPYEKALFGSAGGR